jgi:hypothetical protein
VKPLADLCMRVIVNPWGRKEGPGKWKEYVARMIANER